MHESTPCVHMYSVGIPHAPRRDALCRSHSRVRQQPVGYSGSAPGRYRRASAARAESSALN